MFITDCGSCFHALYIVSIQLQAPLVKSKAGPGNSNISVCINKIHHQTTAKIDLDFEALAGFMYQYETKWQVCCGHVKVFWTDDL